jgi:hypothetical protein
MLASAGDFPKQRKNAMLMLVMHKIGHEKAQD